MCQLLFAQTKSSTLTKFLMLEGLRQASVGNPDGTGVHTPELGVQKTALKASELRSFGFLHKAGPVGMGHVRLASKGIVVTRDNAHPFEGDRFVLAHNGTLWGIDETPLATVVQSRESDSLVYLKALEAEGVSSPKANVAELLTSAMKKFKGKFAFMLYDKRDKRYYCARGKTANLYITYIFSGEPPETPAEKEVYDYTDFIGFMIMTDKATLESATDRAILTESVTTGHGYWFTVGTLLQDEHVFSLDERGATPIGEIKETSAYPAVAETQPYYHRNDGILTTALERKDQAVEAIIADWMYIFNVSPIDFERITLRALGKPICQLDDDDVEWLATILIPLLTPSKDKFSMLRNVVRANEFIFYKKIASVPNLQFPWMLSTKDVLKKAFKVLKGDAK